MASRPIEKNNEKQNGSKAIRVNTSVASNSQDVARPHHFTHQEVDMKLYDAGMAIEISRKKLYDNQVAINAYDEMLKKEREARLKCSQAYEELYQQHGRNLADLSNMATKCLTLHQELEKAQETIHRHEMKMAECEPRLRDRAAPGDAKDRDIDQADWDMVEPAIEQLQERIRVLEEEKVAMKRDHENALINAAERICAADRKLDELAKEKADMTQEHLGILVNAKDRILAAEQKAQEYEMMYLASQAAGLVQTGSDAAPEQTLSPSAGKRQRPEEEGVSQRTRKRRQATKAKGADKIVS